MTTEYTHEENYNASQASMEVLETPFIEHKDEMLAHAINAVLCAKGVGRTHYIAPYEAAKIYSILSHLEDLASVR